MKRYQKFKEPFNSNVAAYTRSFEDTKIIHIQIFENRSHPSLTLVFVVTPTFLGCSQSALGRPLVWQTVHFHYVQKSYFIFTMNDLLLQKQSQSLVFVTSHPGKGFHFRTNPPSLPVGLIQPPVHTPVSSFRLQLNRFFFSIARSTDLKGVTPSRDKKIASFRNISQNRWTLQQGPTLQGPTR